MFHSLSPRLLYFCRRPPVARTCCWRQSSLPHSSLRLLRYNSRRRSSSPLLSHSRPPCVLLPLLLLSFYYLGKLFGHSSGYLFFWFGGQVTACIHALTALLETNDIIVQWTKWLSRWQLNTMNYLTTIIPTRPTMIWWRSEEMRPRKTKNGKIMRLAHWQRSYVDQDDRAE